MNTKQTNRFILMPANRVEASENSNPEIKKFLISLDKKLNSAGSNTLKLTSRNPPKTKASPIHINVVDSIEADGTKLVEIKENEMANFRFSYPGLRIISEQFYRKPPMPFRDFLVKTKKSLQTVSTTIIVKDENNMPIKDAYVVAFTNFDRKEGFAGHTNSAGKIKLHLVSNKIDRLYVYPIHTFWGHYQNNFSIKTSAEIILQRIDIKFTDSLRFFYDTATLPPIQHTVKVAVIDTGVGPHQDIVVKGGANTIEGEDENDFADNGDGHGTHVAGIIGANGNLSGVAAGVEIYSYRVFPKNGDASNFYVMKAIKKAVEDGCDLINLSLGSPDLDEGLISYIKDAYDKGVLCFAANGNDERNPVSYPAAYSLCVAVSALGHKGCFPLDTIQKSTVKAPYGTDKNNFIADFSNIGTETDLTAPGVGIISTFPGNFYAVMDGTSMACPAATGMAARLLSKRPDLLSMPKNQQRTDEIVKFLSVHVKSLGFNPNFEGKGMLF